MSSCVSNFAHTTQYIGLILFYWLASHKPKTTRSMACTFQYFIKWKCSVSWYLSSKWVLNSPVYCTPVMYLKGKEQKQTASGMQRQEAARTSLQMHTNSMCKKWNDIKIAWCLLRLARGHSVSLLTNDAIFLQTCQNSSRRQELNARCFIKRC